MLDVTEIQSIVDDLGRTQGNKRGFFNAVLYYIMFLEAKPVFKSNHDQIFVWATGDYAMHKYLRGLKLESYRKAGAAQLTRDNNREFLDAVGNSSGFPEWNEYRALVKKLSLAFQNAEKEKTQQLEMSLASISEVLASSNVPHVVVAATQAQAGRKLKFNYTYAEEGQNPFTSTVIKNGSSYLFSAGTPKNGHTDVMSMLDPIYPLGTNFKFTSLKIMSDAVVKHNTERGASTNNLVWLDKVPEDDVVSKPLVHNGKKVFAVYVRDVGFFQTVGAGSEMRYVLTRDLKASKPNPRLLLKSETKLIDFSVDFNRENYEKLH